MLTGRSCRIGLLVPGRAQHASALQEALEARQHQRPATVDVLENLAARREFVMGDREPYLVLVALDLEGHSRRALAVQTVVLRMKGIGEPPRRIDFEHRPGDAVAFALELESKRRADLPVRLEAVADPVALGHVGAGPSLEDLFGGCRNVDDVDE